MADKTAAKPAPKPKPKSSPVKNGYLILYNAVSAILWLTVLGRVVGITAVRGPQLAYPAVGEFCKWTQTLAGMEVLHSLFGKSTNLQPLNSSTLQPDRTKLTSSPPSGQPRHRPRPHRDDLHAGLQPVRHRLGRDGALPLAAGREPGVRLDARGLVRDRGGAVLVLRADPVGPAPGAPALAALPRLLRPLPARHLQRGLAHLARRRARARGRLPALRRRAVRLRRLRLPAL